MATKKFLGAAAAKAMLTQSKQWADSALAQSKTYADGHLATAKGYADSEITKVIGGAPENLDTLKEIADILSNDEQTKLGLVQQMAQKANKSTTLSGYGITDGVTSSQLDSALASKMDSADLAELTETEIQAVINEVAG